MNCHYHLSATASCLAYIHFQHGTAPVTTQSSFTLWYVHCMVFWETGVMSSAVIFMMHRYNTCTSKFHHHWETGPWLVKCTCALLSWSPPVGLMLFIQSVYTGREVKSPIIPNVCWYIDSFRAHDLLFRESKKYILKNWACFVWNNVVYAVLVVQG